MNKKCIVPPQNLNSTTQKIVILYNPGLYIVSPRTVFPNLNFLLLLSLNLHLEIPRNEELSKQIEVTSIHDERRNIVLLLNVARSSLNRMRIIIECHNSHTNSNEHLTKLHECHKDGVEPLGTPLHCHQKVVSVHDCMNRVVHDDEEKTTGAGGCVGMPAVEDDSDMMVPM